MDPSEHLERKYWAKKKQTNERTEEEKITAKSRRTKIIKMNGMRYRETVDKREENGIEATKMQPVKESDSLIESGEDNSRRTKIVENEFSKLKNNYDEMVWKPVLALIESADWHNNYYCIRNVFVLLFFRRFFLFICLVYERVHFFSILLLFFFYNASRSFILSLFRLRSPQRALALHSTRPFYSWNSCVLFGSCIVHILFGVR